jgi:UDP:flavonoid glycosyltransferase YjiC (YdhE family)
MMKIALYASSHGFGHASRIAALADSFIRFGIFVYLCTDRPRFLFQELREQDFEYRETRIDRGVVHKENLATDIEATKQALLELFNQREEIVAREVEFLREQRIDLVIADIPFFVIEACAYVGIPVFGVSNFDWSFVYASIFADDEDMQPLINVIWGLYRRLDRSYLLDLGNSRSVPGFRAPISGGLLVREKNVIKDIRAKYQIEDEQPILLLMFGGEGALEIPLELICLAWDGVVMTPYHGSGIQNLITVPQDEDFLSLLYSADLVLCKPGYSTFSEILSMGKSMIYIPRKNYPEEDVLIQGLQEYPAAKMVEDFPTDLRSIRDLFASVLRGNFEHNSSNRELAGRIMADYIGIKYAQDRIVSVCDLGSNNMNYVLFNKSREKVIHRAWCTTGLGKDIKGEHLTERSIMRAFYAMEDILERDKWIDSNKYLIATGVNRKAANAHDLLKRIKSEWSYKTRIISAKDEMKYAWYAALPWMDSGKNNLVIDIGGASTELTWLGLRNKTTGISLDFGLQSLIRDEADGESSILKVRTAFTALPDLLNVNIIAVGLTGTVMLRFINQMSYRQILENPVMRIGINDLQSFRANLKSQQDAYNSVTDSQYELDSINMAALIMQQLLDRYDCWNFMVCNDGISIGYAKWIK